MEGVNTVWNASGEPSMGLQIMWRRLLACAQAWRPALGVAQAVSLHPGLAACATGVDESPQEQDLRSWEGYS